LYYSDVKLTVQGYQGIQGPLRQAKRGEQGKMAIFVSNFGFSAKG
jgi:hypothetical protein